MVVDLNDVTPFLAWLPSAVLTWLVVVACVAVGVTAGRLAGGGGAARPGGRPRGSPAGCLRRGRGRPGAHLAAARVGAGLAGHQGIDPPPGGGGVRGVHPDPAVRRLVSRSRQRSIPPGCTSSFVLTATSYLVLLLALFLSSLSLPADIKNRTLHTVVTKPVRASEVVLGRIVGFTAVGTLLLVVMGAISYVFVDARTGPHPPTDGRRSAAGRRGRAGQPAALQRPHQPRPPAPPQGAPSTPDGRKATCEMEQGTGTRGRCRSDGRQGRRTQLGPPEGMLLARVPIYGKLSFRDRTGQPAEKGINVGDEWTYRSYIEGGTPGRRHLDLRGNHRRGLSRRPARGNDHRACSAPTRATSRRECWAA